MHLILFILFFFPFNIKFFLYSIHCIFLSLAYKLGIHQRKYKQSPCGLDTRTSILILLLVINWYTCQRVNKFCMWLLFDFVSQIWFFVFVLQLVSSYCIWFLFPVSFLLLMEGWISSVVFSWGLSIALFEVLLLTLNSDQFFPFTNYSVFVVDINPCMLNAWLIVYVLN